MNKTIAKMHSHGVSDIGLRRSSNQDQFLLAQVRHPVALGQASVALESTQAGQRTGTLLAVADGMGGNVHGELASRIAIQSLHQYVSSHWRDFVWPPERPDRSVLEHLRAAFHAAQQSITTLSGHDPDLRGMGTTLTVAYVFWPKLYVAHAGDSRCCLLRGWQLRQITTDQTLANLVAESGEDGDLVDKWGGLSRMSHILYNCLGGESDEVDVECHECELEPLDLLLLCSDGLSKHVSERQIAAIVGGAASTAAACRQLMEAAKEAGGTDNITAVVAQCGAARREDCSRPRRATPAHQVPRNRTIR